MFILCTIVVNTPNLFCRIYMLWWCLPLEKVCHKQKSMWSDSNSKIIVQHLHGSRQNAYERPCWSMVPQNLWSKIICWPVKRKLPKIKCEELESYTMSWVYMLQVDTEVCEQVFSWLSRYGKMTRRMNRHTFMFFLLYIIDLHNARELEKLKRSNFI